MEIGALDLHNRKHFLPEHRYEKIPGVTRGCAVYLVVGLLPTCGGYRMCSHMLHSLKQIEPKSQTRNELLFFVMGSKMKLERPVHIQSHLLRKPSII